MKRGKIEKVLIEEKTGKKYYVKDLKDDFHASQGIISQKDLSSGKETVISSKKVSFLCLDPTFPDLWENLQRGPQIMLQKDIGFILAKTGVNRDSRVVDAGGGSGSLCLSLANVCKEVTVYEINPEHYDIVMKNIGLFGMKNISVKQQNVDDGIDENDLDLITLDLPEPWKVITHAEKALKRGGHLVVYLPNLHQVKTFIDSTKKTGIKVIETVELLERKWKIEDKIMRPEFQMLGHTGFLTFCRRF
ncbi:methyltransferase domain-containing protein [Candidatus Woesearchaeota archaeon]|nr:methyltransferase domain-containing protein [Candidatus Woesearchaeota archaeon]